MEPKKRDERWYLRYFDSCPINFFMCGDFIGWVRVPLTSDNEEEARVEASEKWEEICKDNPPGLFKRSYVGYPQQPCLLYICGDQPPHSCGEYDGNAFSYECRQIPLVVRMV